MYFLFENYINLKNQYSINKDSSKELINVYNSTSWKITRPIRLFGKYARYIKQNGIINTGKLILKKIYKRIIK